MTLTIWLMNWLTLIFRTSILTSALIRMQRKNPKLWKMKHPTHTNRKRKSLRKEWQVANFPMMMKNIKSFWQSLKQRKQPMIVIHRPLFMKRLQIM